jgi:predicted house-cleaning noncanonical NTP pyrophosphatase (MazG superfamily)
VHEEADEFKIAGVNEVLGELADLHDVLAALTTALGFTEEQVEAAAAGKRSERGGFRQHLWLDEVRTPSQA